MTEMAASTATDKTYRQIGFEPGFDGIRGTGAVFVLTAHASMIVLPEYDNIGMPELVPGTFVFMDAFFVLSGFLITALLLKEQQRTDKINLLAFYRRRALRLLPALWVLLIVHYIYALIVNYDMQIERETVWSISTFTLNFRMDNILTARVATGLTQLWSLSLEEQFYLIWPLLMILVVPLRRNLRTTVIILVSAIIIIGARRYLMWADGENWLRLYTHTDTRADSLLLGALLAHLWVHKKTPVKYLPAMAWVATAFIAWGLVNLSVDGDFAVLGGYNLLALSWAAILLAAIDGRWFMCRIISTRPLMALGRLSYGVYLWHVPIQFGVARHAQNLPSLMRFALATLLTFIAVYASYKLVEQPIIRFKDKLERKPPLREQSGSTIVSASTVTVPVATIEEADPGLDSGAEPTKA